MKKIILAVLMAAAFTGSAAAQLPGMDGAASFCDPAFQDFVETTYGYLNPRTGIAARLRDSVASPAATTAPRPALVFVSILPKAADYSALLRELSASAGFVLKGERVRLVKGARQVRIVGWARADGVAAIRASSGVAGVAVGKKKASAI
ncbi:MAG: hypothetical protein PHV33_10020 [Elusimicrobiales bacterium]|nr:hypothetical protein [Elusimicrobiales bacterium]